jgi:hypothetical protein
MFEVVDHVVFAIEGFDFKLPPVLGILAEQQPKKRIDNRCLAGTVFAGYCGVFAVKGNRKVSDSFEVTQCDAL